MGKLAGLRQSLAKAQAGWTAYHGTPHKVDKFRMDKIGTGEGAQAYGHGLYFAESPDVAETYRSQLLDRAGVSYEMADGTKYTPISSDISIAMNSIVDGDTGVQDWTKWTDGELEIPSVSELKATLEKHGAPVRRFGGGPGAVYKVDINDAIADRMLDWDAPLSEQSPAVREALAKIEPDHYSPDSPDYDPNEMGQVIYNRIAPKEFVAVGEDGRGFARYKTRDAALSAVGGDKSKVRVVRDPSKEATSAELAKHGIPGLRYLDAGSRQGGNGTRNFVVWDEDQIKILEENGVPYAGVGGQVAAGGAAAATAGGIGAALAPTEQAQAAAAQPAKPDTWENFRNTVLGIAEPALMLANELAYQPVAGLRGLHALASGQGLQAAADAVEDRPMGIGYQPRTEAGMQGAEAMADFMDSLSKQLSPAFGKAGRFEPEARYLADLFL